MLSWLLCLDRWRLKFRALFPAFFLAINTQILTAFIYKNESVVSFLGLIAVLVGFFVCLFFCINDFYIRHTSKQPGPLNGLCGRPVIGSVISEWSFIKPANTKKAWLCWTLVGQPSALNGKGVKIWMLGNLEENLSQDFGVVEDRKLRIQEEDVC